MVSVHPDSIPFGKHPLSSLVLGLGGWSCGAHPPLPPQTQSWAETQPGPAVHSIHLLQCPLRQTRQTWDIWWIHQESEVLIQWASLAMWITSEQRDQRPTGGQACQGEQTERWRQREEKPHEDKGRETAGAARSWRMGRRPPWSL